MEAKLVRTSKQDKQKVYNVPRIQNSHLRCSSNISLDLKFIKTQIILNRYKTEKQANLLYIEGQCKLILDLIWSKHLILSGGAIQIKLTEKLGFERQMCCRFSLRMTPYTQHLAGIWNF